MKIFITAKYQKEWEQKGERKRQSWRIGKQKQKIKGEGRNSAASACFRRGKRVKSWGINQCHKWKKREKRKENLIIS